MRSDTKRRRPAAANEPTTGASGRFVLRLEPGLHALLRLQAAEAGLSLNDFCARKLAAPNPLLEPSGVAVEVVRRAATLFGGAFVGLALYGSFARGEAMEGSDVDLIVAVDPALPLTRELYRRWGEEPLDWEGHAVEVHFAHLPARGADFGGFWAEVALDGIVLHERGFVLSRALIAIRREILAGRIERRAARGQPYWASVDGAPVVA